MYHIFTFWGYQHWSASWIFNSDSVTPPGSLLIDVGRQPSSLLAWIKSHLDIIKCNFCNSYITWSITGSDPSESRKTMQKACLLTGICSAVGLLIIVCTYLSQTRRHSTSIKMTQPVRSLTAIFKLNYIVILRNMNITIKNFCKSTCKFQKMLNMHCPKQRSSNHNSYLSYIIK